MSEVYVHEPSTCGKVVLHTSLGDLDVELWTRECPVACRNFFQLCLNHYYDNVIFHRVIKDFIVQTGDPTGTGRGGTDTTLPDGAPFDLELHPRLKFRYRGLLGVANLSAAQATPATGKGRGTNGNQFFITLSRCDALNNTHTLFGKVTGSSLYNLMKFNDLEVKKNERPAHPPVIKSVEILWNPFSDLLPQLHELVVVDKSAKISDNNNNAKEPTVGDDGVKQQRLQRRDEKLLSFANEDEAGDSSSTEEEEEEAVRKISSHRKEGSEERAPAFFDDDDDDDGGSVATGGGHRGDKVSKDDASVRRSRSQKTAPVLLRKKIVSAHDVLENDPLLVNSAVKGGVSESEDERSSEGEPLSGDEQQQPGSPAAAKALMDHHSSPLRDKGCNTSTPGQRHGCSALAMRVRAQIEALGGGCNSSSSSAGGRSLFPADRRSSPSKRATQKSDSAAAEAAAAVNGGSRLETGEKGFSRKYSCTINGDSNGDEQRQLKQQKEEESHRHVDALRFRTGGGSASRGAHVDKECLEGSDLMNDKEKTRQLNLVRKRDMGRQRRQNETLKKLDAFTQQLRRMREESCKVSVKEDTTNLSPSTQPGKQNEKQKESGTLNALLPDLDDEIDENDGSWLNNGGLHFAVDSARAYELDEARSANIIVSDPLAKKKMLNSSIESRANSIKYAEFQRKHTHAAEWNDGARDIPPW